MTPPYPPVKARRPPVRASVSRRSRGRGHIDARAHGPGVCCGGQHSIAPVSPAGVQGRSLACDPETVTDKDRGPSCRPAELGLDLCPCISPVIVQTAPQPSARKRAHNPEPSCFGGRVLAFPPKHERRSARESNPPRVCPCHQTPTTAGSAPPHHRNPTSGPLGPQPGTAAPAAGPRRRLRLLHLDLDQPDRRVHRP